MLATLLPLLFALSAAPIVALVGLRRPGWVAPFSVVLAGLTFGASCWSWAIGGGRFDLPWAPTWNLRLSFAFDGLGALYTLLAAGIGLAVLVYSSRYLPLHLKHEGRPTQAGVRFYTWLLLFLGAMVGLVLAQDLLLLFVFWDLTAISSYYLIGYDQAKAEARAAALMALLVTGISAIFFLIGAFVLYAQYQTFSLPSLIEQAKPGNPLTIATGLMALAALAKSAQVPFHFWLPRAMVAPTPVSAYLHSAAMVAAGVFLLGRIYPLLQLNEYLLYILLGFGLLSMAVGGVLALIQDELKRLLAYSTIAQYGYVVFMLGLGGQTGAVSATFYVLAHALIKSALFLTAGAVTEATGEERLSHLGGLGRAMPLLALGSGAAAAGLAAFPLTIGFFKDELLFKAALEQGGLFAGLAVLSAALTLAYIWRFWYGIFGGKRRGQAQPLPPELVAPVAFLGLVVVAGGIVVSPFARLAEAAGAVTFGASTPIEPAYHLDARPENLLAGAAYLLGALIIVTRPFWRSAVALVAQMGQRLGPEQWYTAGLARLNQLSSWLYGIESPNLANRFITILIPSALLLGMGLLATPLENTYRVGAVRLADIPLLLTLLVMAVATLIVTLPKNHLTQVLALSSVGYSLTGIYALFGGPDVALVAVLIGTMSTLLFVGMLALFPKEVLARQAARPTLLWQQWRDFLLGVVAGLFAFMVAWAVLSQPAARESVALEHVRLTPTAHARDIVTAILADFRGLDTLGEITVVGIALLGIASLLRLTRVE